MRAAAIAKLAKAGIHLSKRAPYREVCEAIAQVTGTHKPYLSTMEDYVRVYLEPPKSGRYVKPFTPLTTAKHPRAADIDQAQPPMRVMAAAGVQTPRSWGGREASR